jgi:hypothetical protein
MIISLRLNIRLILMGQRRLRGRRLRTGVMDWTGIWKYSKYEFNSMQVIWFLWFRPTLPESRYVDLFIP